MISEISSPNVNLDDLMQMIESEVQHRKPRSSETLQIDPTKINKNGGYLRSKPTKLSLDNIIVPSPPKMGKADYQLSDFMNHHGQNFILSAYAGVLGRHPDPEGCHYYLASLQQGKMTKAEIVGRLRYSSEGRNKAVRIKGLIGPFLIQSSYKIPVLGYLIRLATALLNLPRIIRNVQSLDGYLQDRLLDTHCYINETNHKLESKINEIIDFHSCTENLCSSKADRVELETLSSQKADRTELEAVLQKADQAKVEVIALQKADASKLEQLQLHKADRAELQSMAAQKADRTELEEMAALKVDMAELEKIVWKRTAISILEQLSILIGNQPPELATMPAEEKHMSLVDKLLTLGTATDESESTVQKSTLSLLQDLQNSKADRTELMQKANKTDIMQKADKDQILRLQEELKDARRLLRDHRLNILDQQRRIALLLEETRKRFPEPLDTQQMQVIVSEEEHLLDAMYVSFEDKFRGTRQDIKERQKLYLPYIKEALDRTNNAPIIDLGCGRGEWLELIKESNYPGTGVDRNRIMIGQCLDLGLDVIEADIIEFLKSQEQNSYSVITGFHVIEHLTLKTLLSLFDESLRVLNPGGMIIFETPNPENILVGACYFYSDLTHNNPLVSDSVQFLAEQRGFVRTKIERFHKYSDYFDVEDQDSFKAKWFYCEMDYALIGYKA